MGAVSPARSPAHRRCRRHRPPVAAAAAAACRTPAAHSSPPRPTPTIPAGLLSLSDDLLLQILLKAGAPAVACCAALCARLRAVQQQLAALPAFTSGASFEVDRGAYRTDTEHVERAVLQAREGMPAAVDFALVFVWQSRELG